MFSLLLLLVLVLVLVLVTRSSCRTVKMITTDPAVSLPGRAGSAELLNSSLEKYSEFTICLRLKTYQFSTYPDKESYQYIVSIKNSGNFMLGSYVALPCEQMYSGCTGTYQNKISSWKHGAVFGFLRESSSLLDHFSPWLPEVWTSVCLSSSRLEGSFTVNINGETVYQTREAEGNYFTGENLILMNCVGHWYWENSPHHGALTDLNIWSRVLAQQDLQDWMWCRSEEAGDLVSWETSELDITGGLNLTNIEREEICLNTHNSNKKNYLSFNSIKNLDETVDFCQKIGGQIAVAWDREIFLAMNKSFSGVSCQEKNGFYLGFTDLQVEGQWVDVNTGAPMTWQAWRTGEPNNYGGNEGCAVDLKGRGEFDDIICSSTYCSICEVETLRQTYQLTGVCEESQVDRFYALKSSVLLLGMTGRNLVFSPTDKRWEIIDRDGQLMAFVVKTQLPLGLQPWHFLDTNCTDQGSVLHSHWSRNVEARLSLVERCCYASFMA